jgi:hypothetical protein
LITFRLKDAQTGGRRRRRWRGRKREKRTG